MEALKSGEYDPDRTALLITQTGGGCQASITSTCFESAWQNIIRRFRSFP